MSDYRIVYEKAATKFLRRQNQITRDRIMHAVNKLPYEGDIKYFSDEGIYRLRVGDFRIIYTKDDAIKIINIENIGNRGQIYKRI